MNNISDKKFAKFNLTNDAAKRISFLLCNESENKFFRIKVTGGGCSGFQYHFSFDNKIQKDDLSFKNGDIEVLIDELSLSFIEGSKLEYVDDLSGAFFQVTNPNATASCGCGTSFSI